MNITIDYEASWRNSFLDGSNNEALPNKGRNFVASMTSLKKKENYQVREITKNTVMGILSRLIGDQRKLYQARSSKNYYFSDLEGLISFEDKPEVVNQEIAYIRNMRGSEDQNAFTGMIKVNDPIFKAEYSAVFWGVLTLNLPELCEFIVEDKKLETVISLNPLDILTCLEEIKKRKPVEYEGQVKKASMALQAKFESMKPLNNKDKQLILPLYCSALYLQMQRLERRFDMSEAKSKRGGITGISHNGFTPKDFMNKYSTGEKKKIYGNPYIQEEFIKGEGKVKNKLRKVSGKLLIKVDVELEKAKEVKMLIENAGVSSFYFGKKGLAYVSKISLRG